MGGLVDRMNEKTKRQRDAEYIYELAQQYLAGDLTYEDVMKAFVDAGMTRQDAQEILEEALK